MKKTLLLAGVAALAMSFSPSQAEPGNGCPIVAADTAATECTYTATGAATVIAATPNSWSITVVRDGEPVVLADSESAQVPSTTTINPANGEEVTVTVGPDCAGPACGSIGALLVLETA